MKTGTEKSLHGLACVFEKFNKELVSSGLWNSTDCDIMI